MQLRYLLCMISLAGYLPSTLHLCEPPSPLAPGLSNATAECVSEEEELLSSSSEACIC